MFKQISITLALVLLYSVIYGQPCNNWLSLPSNPSYVAVGDLDVPGNKITVEAVINRTTSWTGGDPYAGDIVSKHVDPTDVNYLLRPNHAEITTTDGFFSTSAICGIDLNKSYHVAMVYDGSTLKFYRNGFLMSQISATGNLIQNDWLTQIGFYEAQLHNTQFIGYINEVKIWNTARTQAQIRQYMNSSLPSPATQTGLLAYYTFDDLINKQGNAAWNGTVRGAAAINQTNPACALVVDSCGLNVTTPPGTVIPSFTIPDTVCVNAPVTITNTTTGAATNYWNFCVADINTPPTGFNMGNPGSMNGPVFMDYVFANNKYYGFVTNYVSGNLVRLDFGNSLLNAPVSTNLGNFGGILQSGSACEGIQVVQNEGKWYAIIVGGSSIAGTQPRIVKIEFGTDLENPSPVATNWGNIGAMEQPIDLHLFQENNNWYGFTVNAEANTIVRFNFTNSFDNTPTAVNLGNVGGLLYPTGIFAINDNGSYRVFVVNGGDRLRDGTQSSLTRLDFGSSLLNTPTGFNLGNPGGLLRHPRDFTIMKFCGQIIGFAVNGNPSSNNIVRLNFNNDLTSIPAITTVGNIGGLDFPHSISKLFRVNDDVFGFITNVVNNTVTRLRFQGCTNASVSSSTLQHPAPVTYNTPGTYNINLTIDDGLPTQASVCQQVVVVDNATPEFSFTKDPCNPGIVRFSNESANGPTAAWDFGNGLTAGNVQQPTVNFGSQGTYTVQLTASTGGRCAQQISKPVVIHLNKEDVITTRDTVLCQPGPLQLNAVPALSFCWMPATGLSNPSIANPVATISSPITYYLTTQSNGTNLVVNGDFNAGNTGFTSQYNYVSTNLSEGEYYVGPSPSAWNSALASCSDHTGGNGNMLLVNGSPTPDARVWSQTITVAPNTDYAFSTWIQALWPPNPAQLSFSINGISLGNMITASLPTCNWSQFYTVWNSGTSTTATISIVNKNTNIIGNDFALDDISFAPLLVKYDSVVIGLGAGTLADFSFSQDACNPTNIQFKDESVNASTISWDFGNGTVAGNDPSPSVSYTSSGTYTVQLTASNGGLCAQQTAKQIEINVNDQDIITTRDTTLCENASITLNAVPALSYCWTPATGLSDPSIANPVATLSGPITYYLNARTTGTNLVVNGNFNAGNTGFTSQYNYTSNNVTEGQYFVGPSPAAWNSALSNCTDHTTGSGNMLLINGSPTPDVNVWRQTINVSPNTNYAFSTWIQALYPPNPAQLSFSINGVAIGDMITASLPTCTWTQFYTLWNSGSSTTATISIVNKNTQIQGNDFALDDISFAPMTIKRDSVKLTIEYPVVKTNNDTTVCNGQPVPLQATGGATYVWTPTTGLSNATIANPVATPDVTTEYHVTGTTRYGCTADDRVTISVQPKPVILNAHDLLVCPNVPVQLAANSALQSYNWSPAATLNNPAIYNPIASPNTTTTYTVTVQDVNNCTYKDSITVQLQGFIVSASPDMPVCHGSSTTLHATGGDLYTWTPAASLNDAAVDAPIATPDVTTTYSVYIAETTCGRDTTLYTTLTVNPSPTITVRKSNDINCTSPSTMLDAEGANRYLWSPASAVDFPTQPHVQAGVDTTTIFYVTGMNEFGCTNTASIKVNATVAGAVTFVVPNAFTPNGDGHNDCISIKKWGSAAIEEFSIYTRFGERVFSTNDPFKCWDGRYKGKIMDAGGYAYVIRARTLCGPIKRTGMIMLIK